ncbi:MAG: flagellar assembly peptidoglycan hydrolase FlgJ [Gammaproteobacteria bacterium]
MQTSTAGGYVDFSRFSALRQASQVDGAGTLEQVADEFEAMLVELMLTAARSASPGDGLFDSAAGDTYQDMFDQQVARTLASQQDLGIGRVLARQLAGFIEGDDAARALADRQREAGGDGALRPLPVDLRRQMGPSPYARTRAVVTAPEPLTGDQGEHRETFIATLTPHAEQAARALGVAPRAILAQAALETGWGRHVMSHADGRSSHNYFGIKAGSEWHGEVVEVPTTEYVNGRAVTIDAAFRSYPDAAAAFRDYTSLLSRSPRYREAIGQGSDGAGFARGLAAAGYATDPRYAEKIIAIIETGDWSAHARPPDAPHGG